ncbi:MAG: hypothetical protein O7D86_14405 [Proteobacteria bacterium]|nr:hypothetical protein [Pseudomonadota bacterium]
MKYFLTKGVDNSSLIEGRISVARRQESEATAQDAYTDVGGRLRLEQVVEQRNIYYIL